MEHAGATEKQAHSIAHTFARRPEPIIKRKVINNTLGAYLGKRKAKPCFETMLAHRIIVPERAKKTKPSPSDVLAIDYGACAPTSDHEIAPAQHPKPTSSQLTPDAQRIIQHADRLRALDAWLTRLAQHDPVPATRGQRAYEIFNDEKALNPNIERDFVHLIKQNSITDEVLGISKVTTNELKSFIPHGGKGPIIVVENGDSYETLRHILGWRKRTRILGMPIGGVVFGDGMNICTPGLLDATLRQLGYTMNYAYYWGDIDRVGVKEFTGARKANIAHPTSNWRDRFIATWSNFKKSGSARGLSLRRPTISRFPRG